MSLLSMMNTVFPRIGISTPAQIVTSTNPKVLEVLAMANEEGQELAARSQWQALTREGTFTTVATESQGVITTIAGADFDYIINETIWNRSLQRPVFRPRTPAQWQQIKAQFMNGPFNQYRIRGNQVLFTPVPAAGQACYFEWMSKNWVTLKAGGTGDAWASDYDVGLLDERFAAREQGQLLDLRARQSAVRAQSTEQELSGLRRDSHSGAGENLGDHRIEVAGLVEKPRIYDIDEILKLPLEERLYRHRCVEAWYMDVPWIGVPLKALLEPCRPLSKASYVSFVSVLKKDQMPGQKGFTWYRWPYYEGLTIGEAMNELTLAAVGIYGHELPRQNGAALRVVVPWKYGYKGAKAVVRIELIDKKPRTFWNDLQPDEYGFESNVNPAVPHPRWSQATERAIDGGPSRKTRLYNGYAEWVGHLYKA